jgi:ribosome-associated toxin RatA of RatAB toxin-antitoxin module
MWTVPGILVKVILVYYCDQLIDAKISVVKHNRSFSAVNSHWYFWSADGSAPSVMLELKFLPSADFTVFFGGEG